jgi:outer membrane biosynthesis protein TonB
MGSKSDKSKKAASKKKPDSKKKLDSKKKPDSKKKASKAAAPKPVAKAPKPAKRAAPAPQATRVPSTGPTPPALTRGTARPAAAIRGPVPSGSGTVVALRARARESGLVGYSRLTKAQLVALLEGK